ncbi:MAG TPA: F0F1 ATP synthase subunit epsilon, partial [Blastocatellia bacterium]|nr:F0F1 ATP synthase subunit epsilon [Blastocatellia bacterium]
MADRLRLRVYSPERQLVDADVAEVTAPGAYGEIGVLPDHAALVTTLEAGILSYRSGTITSRIKVNGG